MSVTVAIDDVIVGEAEYVSPTRWNGFACPGFTRAQVEALLPQVAANATEDDSTFRFDGDVLVEVHPAYFVEEFGDEPESIVPTFERDGVTLYTFGEGWVWQTVEAAR